MNSRKYSKYQVQLNDLARTANTLSKWGHSVKKTMALTGNYSPTNYTWLRDNKHSPLKA